MRRVKHANKFMIQCDMLLWISLGSSNSIYFFYWNKQKITFGWRAVRCAGGTNGVEAPPPGANKEETDG